MTLEKVIDTIKEPDSEAASLAKRRWDSVAKPLNSLGVLERDLIRIAGVKGTPRFSIGRKAIVVMCADNGIVAEGVTQTGREVTAIVAEHMGEGTSCVCRMAAVAGAQVIPVDIGIAGEVSSPGILRMKVAPGTRNFLKEAAMSRRETVQALETGIAVAGEMSRRGFELLGSGEMGIGNTTTSSAVLSVLLEQPAGLVTGRGAGLDTPSLHRKIAVIEEGIRLRCPDKRDGIDVLSKVGGLDLAGLAGLYIGCAYYGIPAVLDGLICAAAALAAVRICPAVGGYLLASHVSAEPAGAMALEALGLEPAINAGMCLGEGTGAAALFPLLDMALAVYDGMSTFGEMQVEQYQPLT
ncbi:MAG: nicotinate-nucleotide--dimethylbenzimidazole phosphoribosyltransferase [Clostridium sp.]|nr:nicotinate-nucleotide--dimethylbenzimidazole phosphoribosyltransferase [Clostridium sp.]